MNRLRAWPWTQILLALLLISTVVNVVETARLRKAIEDATFTFSNTDISGNVGDLETDIEQLKTVLQEIDHNTSCIYNPYQMGCPIRLPAH